MNDLAVHFSSARQDWGTPPDFFEHWHARYHFDIDVCASAANRKLDRYWSEEDDALTQEWAPMRCWMNPPYGRTSTPQWVKKAYSESLHGALVACLLPARTDTAWFHDYCKQGEITFIRGRLTFEGAKDPAPFPSMVVVFAQSWIKK